MAFTKWSDIRDEHIERIGAGEFEAGKEQMLAEARGWRLAEIRRHRGLTQAEVAARMVSTSPLVRVLATSRAPLGVPGEVVVQGGPLESDG